MDVRRGQQTPATVRVNSVDGSVACADDQCSGAQIAPSRGGGRETASDDRWVTRRRRGGDGYGCLAAGVVPALLWVAECSGPRPQLAEAPGLSPRR